MLYINLTDYYNVTYMIDGEVIEIQIIEHGNYDTEPELSLEQVSYFEGILYTVGEIISEVVYSLNNNYIVRITIDVLA